MKKFFTICLTGLFLSLFSLKASAESVVYIIMGADCPVVPTIPISINGEHVFNMDLKLKKTQFDIEIYKRAVKKLVFNTEDKFIISYDYPWFDGMQHDEIIINAVDGETYYVQLFSKWNNKFKQLKEKDALKKLKKTDEYDTLPDYVYPKE